MYNNKTTGFEIVKGIALLTPLIISIIVLLIVIIDSQSTTTFSDAIESKINMGIAIIGLAVTVWVGLNIYTLVENKQFNSLISKIQETDNMLDKINQRMLMEEKRLTYTHHFINWSDYYLRLHSAVHFLNEIDEDIFVKGVNNYLELFSNLEKANDEIEQSYLINYKRHIIILYSVIDQFNQFDYISKNFEYGKLISQIRKVLESINKTVLFAGDNYFQEYLEYHTEILNITKQHSDLCYLCLEILGKYESVKKN
jgi:hypothetical protein